MRKRKPTSGEMIDDAVLAEEPSAEMPKWASNVGLGICGAVAWLFRALFPVAKT